MRLSSWGRQQFCGIATGADRSDSVGSAHRRLGVLQGSETLLGLKRHARGGEVVSQDALKSGASRGSGGVDVRRAQGVLRCGASG